jgi:hypothetical protein
MQHIYDSSSPFSSFLFFFFWAEVIKLLVTETNWYYHHYLDTPDDGLSPVSDVTEYEMFLFTAVTVQLGHCIQNWQMEYCTTMDHFYTPFYSNMIKWDRFLHIPSFLHFSVNRTETDKVDKIYDTS